MKRALAPLLLLLGSVLVSGACAECGLRLWQTGSLRGLSGEHSLRMPHATRGWTLVPDGESFQRTRDYGVLVHTNAEGLRDRPHASLPAAGAFRIVVLGDSFMEAYQVTLEESLPYRLQELLAPRGVEVVNLGVGGYGTAQALLYLEEEGLRYRPELVVLAFYTGNDVQNNSREIETALFGEEAVTTFSRPYARAQGLAAPLEWTPPDALRMAPYALRWERRRDSWLDALRRMLQPAMLANLLEQATARLWSREREPYDPNWLFGWPFLARFAPAPPDAASPDYARAWSEAWLATRRLLLEMDHVAREAGARLAVLVVPAEFQVVPATEAAIAAAQPELELDPLRINRELAAFCARSGIPLLDPTPELARAQAQGPPVYYAREDHHWNAAGHALVTQLLASFLDERGLVPGAPEDSDQASSTSR